MQTSQPLEQASSTALNGQKSEDKQDMYVWQLPVRLTHWVNVISIGVLTVTGLYIASPFIIGTADDAANQYLMGTIRLVHFITAFVFTASVLFRLYWFFAGNKWANWRQFLPVQRARRRGLRRMLGFYVFVRRRGPAVIGHNPLAGLTYTVIFLLFLLQIITGFALYALPFHGGFWPAVFGWITVAFGVQPVRLLHDIVMWLFLGFVVHHVYSAILIDIDERSGVLSSIFSGYKSFSQHHLLEAQAEEASPPKRVHASKRRRAGARNNGDVSGHV